MPPRRLRRQESATEVVDLTSTPAESAQNNKKRKRSEDCQSDEDESKASSQRADTIEEPAGTAAHTRIGAMSCIICMESYTNATVAHCGHIFCHECLCRALTASERNTSRGVGVCPSCRKPIKRSKANQIIPINFLKKSSLRKR